MRGERRNGEKRAKCGKKIKKHVNFYERGSEIKNDYFSDMPMILLVYKKAYFNTNDLDHCLSSV